MPPAPYAHQYGFVGLSLTEFEGATFTTCGTKLCPAATKTTFPVSAANLAGGKFFQTGEQYIKFMAYDEYTIEMCAGAMVGYVLFARLISYLALRFIKT